MVPFCVLRMRMYYAKQFYLSKKTVVAIIFIIILLSPVSSDDAVVLNLRGNKSLSSACCVKWKFQRIVLLHFSIAC